MGLQRLRGLLRKVSLCHHFSQVLTLRTLHTIQNKPGEMGVSWVVWRHNEFFLLLYHLPTPNPQVIPQSTHCWLVSVHLVQSHSGKRKTVLPTIPDYKLVLVSHPKNSPKHNLAGSTQKPLKRTWSCHGKMFVRIHSASDTEPDLCNVPP